MEDKEIGIYGEAIACQYFVDRNFDILDKNYKKKWGELDLVIKKEDIIHFVEVKTVSYVTKTDLAREYKESTFRPEDRVDDKKKQKIIRLIDAWFLEYGNNQQYQFDIVSVYIVPREKFATVEWFSNVEV